MHHAPITPATLLVAARSVPADRTYCGRKVYLVDVWARWNEVASERGLGLPLSQFLAFVAACPECRRVLSRADLVQAMDADRLERSEARWSTCTWHFVRLN